MKAKRARAAMARRARAALRFACATAWVVSATSGHAAETVRDDRGVVVTFASSPQRIVSLLPSLTETVCALDACARLVGTDRFSRWPASVTVLPKLGGVDDAEIERIVALKPDVVLVAPSARVVDRLEALGVTVLVIESRNEADVKRSLDLLARVLGVPDKGREVWAGIERDTRAAAARVPMSLRGKRVYFEIDPTPYAAGASSFIGELLAQLGLANVVAPALGPFPKLNPEAVVRARPDVVMAARASLATMIERPGWSALRALQRDQTCGFTPEQSALLTRPGPRMGEAAGVIAECLVAIEARHAIENGSIENGSIERGVR